MQINADVKKNICIMQAKEITTICNPIFMQYNLNAFAYSRVFPDGSRSELWSDSSAMEHTFFKKKYLCDLYTPDLYSADEKYLLLKSKVETFNFKLKSKYINQLSDQKNYFNHDHSFMIINKNRELCEYFIFYAPTLHNAVINTYLNKLDLFENFIKDFKYMAASLIKKADENKIISPWRFIENNKISNTVICSLPNNKLSPREHHVVSLLVQGNTAKQVANLLGVSYRTVESHIQNAKFKLNCKKASELIIKSLKTELA